MYCNTRGQILEKLLSARGGTVEATITAKLTHLVCDPVHLRSLPSTGKGARPKLPPRARIATPEWVAACIKAKGCLPLPRVPPSNLPPPSS